jgi:hypothetical protein
MHRRAPGAQIVLGLEKSLREPSGVDESLNVVGVSVAVAVEIMVGPSGISRHRPAAQRIPSPDCNKQAGLRVTTGYRRGFDGLEGAAAFSVSAAAWGGAKGRGDQEPFPFPREGQPPTERVRT